MEKGIPERFAPECNMSPSDVGGFLGSTEPINLFHYHGHGEIPPINTGFNDAEEKANKK